MNEENPIEVEACLQLCDSFDHFRKEGKFIDFVIQCDDQTFYVHKVILAASSNYFADLIEANDSNKKLEITISDLNPAILSQILDFIYSPKRVKDPKDLVSLFHAAAELEVPLLVDHCWQRIIETNPEDPLSYLIEILSNSDCIKARAMRYCVDNFGSVIKMLSFWKLTIDFIMTVLENVSKTVDEKIYILLNWIRHDDKERLQYVPDIMKAIDFNLLSELTLLDLAEDQLLLKDTNFMAGILQAIKTKFRAKILSCPSSSASETSLEEVTENLHQLSRTDKVKHEESTVDFPEKIRSLASSNELITSDKSPRFFPKIMLADKNAVNENVSLVLVTSTRIGSTIHLFDDKLVKKSFTRDLLPVKASIVWMDNKIYIFGGRETHSWQVLQSTIIFCCKTKQWHSGANMNIARYASDAAVLNGYIYVVGGITKSNTRTNVVERYNPLFDNWKTMTPMKFHRENAAVVARKEHLLVIGGYAIGKDDEKLPSDDEASCEMYDPLTDQWTTMHIVGLPVGRQPTEKSFRVVFLNDTVYAIRRELVDRNTCHVLYKNAKMGSFVKTCSFNVPLKEIVVMGMLNVSTCIIDVEGNLVLADTAQNIILPTVRIDVKKETIMYGTFALNVV